MVFVGRRCDRAEQSDPFPSLKTRSSTKNRLFIDHLTHCLKRFAARNTYRYLLSLPWMASGLQIMAALDPAAARNKGGRNSRGLRPALVRAMGTRPRKFLQRTAVHRDLAPTRSNSNPEKDRHLLLPRRKGQASFASDRRASREATTCDSHGRESVGHATPRHARVATRRQVSRGRNQTGRRWAGTGIPGPDLQVAGYRRIGIQNEEHERTKTKRKQKNRKVIFHCEHPLSHVASAAQDP